MTDRNIEKTFSSKKAMLANLATQMHTTIDAIALAAVMQQTWTDVVLSGAATVPQLQSNVAALEVDLGNNITELLSNMKEQPEQYWSKRSQLAWN